jgi:hypothetical protein
LLCEPPLLFYASPWFVGGLGPGRLYPDRHGQSGRVEWGSVGKLRASPFTKRSADQQAIEASKISSIGMALGNALGGTDTNQFQKIH